MTAEKKATYADLVRFRSELPEHVLNAALKLKALWASAPTDEKNCAFCQIVENGEIDREVETCEHYERLSDALDSINQIERALSKEDKELLKRSSSMSSDAYLYLWRLEKEASTALGIPEGYLVRNLWEALPEGYYAVPDPRADVEKMTYWRRSEGKRGPAFKAWPNNKARYGPRLTWDDLPAPRDKYSEENQWFMRAWHEIVGEPYRDAIVEALMEDPIAAQHRFADFNTRCCSCGKKLTNDISKVYGIGPECRRGIPAEVLANYYRPKIGRAHALVTNSH